MSFFKDIIFSEQNLYWSIAMMFLFVLFFMNLRKDVYKRSPLPSFVATIGIIGTFYGISIGLQDFNPQELSNGMEPITNLLEGMKTAFSTSLLGMFLSLLMKSLQQIAIYYSPLSLPKTRSEEYLEKMVKILEEELQSSREDTTKLVSSNNQMISEFRNFSKTMVQEHNEAFINTLNKCIKDLNEYLVEQLGENFKHLDSSVKTLTEWQKLYKKDLEKNFASQEELLSKIEGSKNDLFILINQKSEISSLTKTLNEVLYKIETSTNKVNKGLNTFEEISNGALEVIPSLGQLNKNLQYSIDGIAKHSITAHDSIESCSKKLNDHFTEFSENLKGSITNTENQSIEVLSDFAKNLERDIKNINTSVEKYKKTFENSGDLILKNINDVSKSIESNSAIISEVTKENIESIAQEHYSKLVEINEELARNLNDQVNESVEMIGTNLGSLSEKFAEDYGPITEKLRRITKTAEESA